MRIISGSFRGKKIIEPNDSKTRPLKDLTKESIFNIINHSNKFKIEIEKSNVLDLFSGVGSFGIECLSRGVKNVIFIENYIGVLSILKKNIQNLKSINNYKIIEGDVYSEIELLSLEDKFDIIFLDPPYKDKNLPKILTSIYKKKILDKEGIIIIHRHKKEKDILPEFCSIIEEKKYNLSKIIFLSLL
jgi:16S rRNA (guanine966-N2)-methyltransferase